RRPLRAPRLASTGREGGAPTVRAGSLEPPRPKNRGTESPPARIHATAPARRRGGPPQTQVLRLAFPEAGGRPQVRRRRPPRAPGGERRLAAAPNRPPLEFRPRKPRESALRLRGLVTRSYRRPEGSGRGRRTALASRQRRWVREPRRQQGARSARIAPPPLLE